MRTTLILPAVLLCFTSTALAQSVLDRSPNLSGGWTGSPNTAYFNFLHRFTASPPPERQISNTPTFLLGYSPAQNLLTGLNYATRSDVAPRFPNEWEFFARARRLDVFAIEGAYNNAAKSADGELSASRAISRFSLSVAARAFSHAYDADSARFALAGGAVVHLTRFVAIAGDVATLVHRSDAEKLAWSGALQLALPSTPHTLSLQVTNTNSGTLEGESRGQTGRRYGFEFTIPLHFSRFRSAASQEFPAGTTHVIFKNLAYNPARLTIKRGTTVAWRNEDQLAHTVTAADHSWTSPPLASGAVFTHRFDEPGQYEITCTPHPFMKLIVEVLP